MPTMRFTLEGVTELNDRLLRTQTHWKQMSVPFQRALLIMYASIKTNFSSGGRPGWPPLKVRQGQPLRDTGRLMASVTTNASLTKESHSPTYHSLEMGTNVSYAAVHQFGSSKTVTQSVRAHSRRITQAFGRSISPRSVAVKAHSRTIRQNIPARPFLMFQESDRADITQMLLEYLNEGWQ